MRRIFFTVLYVFIYLNSLAQIEEKAGRLNNEAYNSMLEGKYEEAIKAFTEAISIDSSESVFFKNRAYAFVKLKKDSNALKDYQRALSLDPVDPDLYYNIGNIFQRSNRPDKAIDNYSKAIENTYKTYKREKSDIYYFNRGNIYLKNKEYEKALADYDSTEEINKHFYSLYQNRGIVKYRLKNKEGACKDWYIASKFDYENAEKYFKKNCDSTSINVVCAHAEFPGGKLGLRRFIAENVFYPAHCRQMGHQGTVIINFEISIDGKIKILNAYSLCKDDLINAAVKAVLSSEDQWTPGNINGINIKSTFSIPVTFRLGIQNDNKKDYKTQAFDFLKSGNKKKAKEKFAEYLLWHPNDTFAARKAFEISSELNDINYSYHFKKLLNQKNEDGKVSSELKQTLYIKNQTIFYNDQFELTKESDSLYYRVTHWNPDISYFDSTFNDYTKDGNLLHTGSYIGGKKNGNFKFYDIKTNKIIASGNFNNDKLNEIWDFYYSSGNIKDKIIFKPSYFKVFYHYSVSGDTLVNNGTGNWTYKINSWDGKNDLTVSGYQIDGLREGLWFVKRDEDIIVQEKYKKGKFVKGKFHDGKNKETLYSTVISQWIFISPYLTRMENLIPENESVKEHYPYITKFGSEN